MHMRRRGGYGTGFCQRFGRFPKLPRLEPGRRRLWIHAVSLGEVQALKVLVEKLLADGRYDIVHTATSSSGLSMARKLYNGLATVLAFPIDFWIFSKNAWNCIEPDVLIHADGELWPEHLHQAHLRSVPVVVANCRLSERSFRRHMRFRFLSNGIWRSVTDIFPDGPATVDRLRRLSVDDNKIHRPGNIKCDRTPMDPLSPSARAAILEEIGLPGHGLDGGETPILVGCSTWPGEEEFLVDVLARLRIGNPNWRLLLVPRHCERRMELKKMLERRGLPFHMRSFGRAKSTDATVALVDSVGELAQFMGVGTIAFLGKTLPPNDGAQSPLDAIAAAVALVAGPAVGNFSDMIGELLAEKAISMGRCASEVADLLVAIGESPSLRKCMAETATKWLRRSCGTADRICKRIETLAFRETLKTIVD
jgi:3-deoxy-D-manno-octulosonic-acid transferase